MNDRKLLMINDDGDKQCDLAPSAPTKSSVQKKYGLFA